MMVGRTVSRPKLSPIEPGTPVLQIENLTSEGMGATALKQLNLTVYAHQIVGIAGVAGNGQGTLADILSGLNSSFTGSLLINDAAYCTGDPRAIVASGVGRIPEDRHARGMVVDMEIWENLMSEDIRSPAMSKHEILINSKAALRRAEQQIDQFDVRCEGPMAETRLLSGGNMQKLILARALARDPALILANQPVRGLDEGAIAHVQGQLLEARQRGAAILLISEDLDELMSLTDKMAVMSNGKLSAVFDSQQHSAAEIGLMMASGGHFEATTGQDSGTGELRGH